MRVRSIPGVLSWSARKGESTGFDVKWTASWDPQSRSTRYGLTSVGRLSPEEYAAVLVEARRVVDG